MSPNRSRDEAQLREIERPQVSSCGKPLTTILERANGRAQGHCSPIKLPLGNPHFNDHQQQQAQEHIGLHFARVHWSPVDKNNVQWNGHVRFCDK